MVDEVSRPRVGPTLASHELAALCKVRAWSGGVGTPRQLPPVGGYELQMVMKASRMRDVSCRGFVGQMCVAVGWPGPGLSAGVGGELAV